MTLDPNFHTNNDYCPYMDYIGKNDKKICMGQIRHIIAQGLWAPPQQVTKNTVNQLYLAAIKFGGFATF